MKKVIGFLAVFAILALLIGTALAEDIPIDAAHFPDDNFRAYVMENCDPNKDGILSEEEQYGVTSIGVTGMNITSIEGIAYFPALQTLYCDNNQLTSLDVSANTALQWLYCFGNQLTSLDVSANTDLQTLDCDGNERTVTAENGQFDLSILPGFDVTKAGNWKGGTVSGTVLTVPASGDVTYTYDCGKGYEQIFTLKIIVFFQQ